MFTRSGSAKDRRPQARDAALLSVSLRSKMTLSDFNSDILGMVTGSGCYPRTLFTSSASRREAMPSLATPPFRIIVLL
jgi:hypothetical protein